MAQSPTTRSAPLASRLFLRIYATFVVSVLIFAVLAGLLVWAAASAWNEERLSSMLARAEASGAALAAAVVTKDEAEVERIAAVLEAELDAEVHVLPRLRGRRLGPPIGGPPEAKRRRDRPPVHEHPLTRADIRRIREGRPVVRRHGLAPPTIGLPLFESGFASAGLDDEDDEALDARDRGRFIAIVAIDPNHNPRRGLVIVGLLLLLALGGGAWPLARSLTSRLAKLERSTRALARGELSHRAELAHAAPRDEVDRLAVAFNEMAERLETLVTGQRTLLANVSHELRTPIARTKVLVEILGERVEQLREAERSGAPVDPADIARLERGLAEMQEDLAEVESLIRDLLTSGRLELGRDGALALEDLELAELCSTAAARFDAVVECPAGLRLRGDRLLLERLVRNILANARRACPEGRLTVHGARERDELVITIEDEGPGIPAGKRSYIFEPFARLDAARARDHGGVGLGLYLCRQITAAHGGNIRAEDREDGRPGARFIIRLPAAAGS